MNVWRRAVSAINAAIQDWQSAPADLEVDAQQARYLERWYLFTGELFTDMLRANPYRDDPRIYRNTSLLWKHHEAVVNFYASVVYQGDLSTDGKPLPDGTKGAIPIDPQIGDETKDAILRTAISELWSAWNWRQQMSLRPMYGAALGDVLTELVDDLDRGFVFPRIIWPGYVTKIELDYVGNVMSYVLDYSVTEVDDKGVTDTYQYRKEVDKESFRYFKNDQPFDYFGEGAVVPNPYGFVPAIWDRHRITWGERGASATDGTRQAVLQLNSVFSHALDYQRKAFFAPIIVSGKLTQQNQTNIQMSAPPQRSRDASGLAQSLNILETDNPAVTIQQAVFDVGQTREFLQDIITSIEAENPEAKVYTELRTMSQVTAPGAERILGDVKARVDLARAGYDANTVKLFQMALSMCGYRTGNGWRTPLSKRQRVFSSYTLDSYKAGDMDFGISSRAMIVPSETERIQLISLKESLQTQWGLEQAGESADDAALIIAQKRDAQAFSVVGDFASTDTTDTSTSDTTDEAA